MQKNSNNSTVGTDRRLASMLTHVFWRYRWKSHAEKDFFILLQGCLTRTKKLRSAEPRRLVGTSGVFICPSHDHISWHEFEEDSSTLSSSRTLLHTVSLIDCIDLLCSLPIKVSPTPGRPSTDFQPSTLSDCAACFLIQAHVMPLLLTGLRLFSCWWEKQPHW